MGDEVQEGPVDIEEQPDLSRPQLHRPYSPEHSLVNESGSPMVPPKRRPTADAPARPDRESGLGRYGCGQHEPVAYNDTDQQNDCHRGTKGS